MQMMGAERKLFERVIIEKTRRSILAEIEAKRAGQDEGYGFPVGTTTARALSFWLVRLMKILGETATWADGSSPVRYRKTLIDLAAEILEVIEFVDLAKSPLNQ